MTTNHINQKIAIHEHSSATFSQLAQSSRSGEDPVDVCKGKSLPHSVPDQQAEDFPGFQTDPLPPGWPFRSGEQKIQGIVPGGAQLDRLSHSVQLAATAVLQQVLGGFFVVCVRVGEEDKLN
ncbi:hypothetical protein BaRGS_00035101 [Batillaria attramentaria]|uniref:Uncharacterized protein n=1 Tax=Batillaria attramentaria TaxID=370345 RepID=A0ABD0JFK6_9CAEN